jgi:hypothetical protein
MTTTGLRHGSVAVAVLALIVAGVVVAIRTRGIESLSAAEVRAIEAAMRDGAPAPGNGYALALKAWMTVLGEADRVIRSLSVAFAVAALLPLGWIAFRRGAVVALVAMAIMATSWPFIAIAGDAQSMALTMALSTGAMAVLAWAMSGRRWRLLPAVAVTAVGIGVEPAVLLVVPAQVAWVLMDGPANRGREIGGTVLAWGAVLTGVLIVLGGVVLLARPDIVAEPTGLDGGLALAGPGRAGALWLVVAGSSLVVAGLRRARAPTGADPGPGSSITVLALAWATLPLVIGVVWAAATGRGVGDAVAVALPGIALAIAGTAHSVSWRSGWPAAMTLIASAGLLLVAVAPNSPLRTATRTDWRAVADILATDGTRWDRLLDPGPGPMSAIVYYGRARGVLDRMPPPVDPADAALADPRGPFRLWTLATAEPIAPPQAGFLTVSTQDTRTFSVRLEQRATVDATVAVVGATASGVQAAVSAARAGADVVLVAATLDVGGMVTNGLGHTDIGDKTTVGGQTREFYERIARIYELGRFGHFIAWDHEPWVARRAFEAMLDEAGVRVIPAAPMDRTVGPTMTDSQIEDIVTPDGTRISASTFIDATYEGDLLAAANVPYAVGREGRATYGESLAGVRPVSTPGYKAQVYGRYFGTGRPLPGVAAEPAEPVGTADRLIQAYTFRLCVTDVPSNQIPFAKPTGYQRRDFVLVERAIATWTRRAGTPPPLEAMVTITRLPNGKGDLNNAGLYSTDLVGGSTLWPDADDAERARIQDVHTAWVAGYLFFLRSDPAVPASLREAISAWGLCADEFITTDGWPTQLYVREARRMVGEVVLTQRDVMTGHAHAEPVALGSYRIDNHYVQRVLDPDGIVLGEGAMSGPVQPYQIPMDVMIPPRGTVDNLVVSVAVSTSHVAWTSLRMEPTFMMLGEAAGLIAVERSRTGVPTWDVPYAPIGSALLGRGAVLTLD